jgi:hypothetical protein
MLWLRSSPLNPWPYMLMLSEQLPCFPSFRYGAAICGMQTVGIVKALSTCKDSNFNDQ